MSKKRELSAEEHMTFRDAVKQVTRLKPTDTHTPETKQKKPLRRQNRQDFEEPVNPYIELQAQEEVDGEDGLFFAREGLQHKLLQKMKRGQVSIEASLDLHGLTVEQASIILNEFITDCCQQGKRWICLVHGKGHYSPTGRPVLKNWANQWLRGHPHVLAFHSAKPKNGGTGALYILLKRKGR